MTNTTWTKCIDCLQKELPAQQFNTWIRPLQVDLDGATLRLLAPNRFVKDWVAQRYLSRINEIVVTDLQADGVEQVELIIGSRRAAETKVDNERTPVRSVPPKNNAAAVVSKGNAESAKKTGLGLHRNDLNKTFTFESFVEGKSNQLARAAALQVAENPGGAYNPLFIYGGVGLGKTHLMHAVGNYLVQRKPDAKVVYLHSERFVADMVKAFQSNTINEFKRFIAPLTRY